jgi:hypothetical protein
MKFSTSILLIFFVCNSWISIGQKKHYSTFEVQLDSLGSPDTLTHEQIKTVYQIYVKETLPDGKIVDCEILEGKIYVAGVSGKGVILEGGKIKCYGENNDKNILWQSRNKNVTVFVSYVKSKGEERFGTLALDVRG